MHSITIQDATKFREALQFAKSVNQEANFQAGFARLLSLLTGYAPDREAEAGERVEIVVRPDFVPHSFVGFTGFSPKEGKYRTLFTAGFIRHKRGSDATPTYEWSIHT